jgi:hypothetical protein B2_07877
MKERILQFIEYKKLSKNKFYKITGLSNGILDKKSGLSADSLEKIYYVYPEINLHWLLTGRGDMLRKEGVIQQAQGNVSIEENNQIGDNYQKISGNGKYTAGSRNVISEFGSNKDKFDELMEIIREKDKQIESLHKIIDKLSK